MIPDFPIDIKIRLAELNFLGVKIGCHSRINPECNTERGFIDSLYIALGIEITKLRNRSDKI